MAFQNSRQGSDLEVLMTSMDASNLYKDDYKAKKQKLSKQGTRCQVCGKAACNTHLLQACVTCSDSLEKKRLHVVE